MNRSRMMMVSVLVTGMTMLTGTSHAEESLILYEMRYVGHGPSIPRTSKCRSSTRLLNSR